MYEEMRKIEDRWITEQEGEEEGNQYSPPKIPSAEKLGRKLFTSLKFLNIFTLEVLSRTAYL